MDHLIMTAENLTNTYHHHSELLDQAQEKTEVILQTLNKASESASAVQSSIGTPGWAGWWPFVVCPTLSLMMGSYGLPPSIFRNLGLIALGLTQCLCLSLILAYSPSHTGEFAGLAISYAEHLSSFLSNDTSSQMALKPKSNQTISLDNVPHDMITLVSADLLRRKVRNDAS